VTGTEVAWIDRIDAPSVPHGKWLAGKRCYGTRVLLSP
jgi:hypothetical protein